MQVDQNEADVFFRNDFPTRLIEESQASFEKLFELVGLAKYWPIKGQEKKVLVIGGATLAFEAYTLFSEDDTGMVDMVDSGIVDGTSATRLLKLYRSRVTSRYHCLGGTEFLGSGMAQQYNLTTFLRIPDLSDQLTETPLLEKVAGHTLHGGVVVMSGSWWNKGKELPTVGGLSLIEDVKLPESFDQWFQCKNHRGLLWVKE